MLYIITSFNALCGSVKQVLTLSPPSFHFPVAQGGSEGEWGKQLACSEADPGRPGVPSRRTRSSWTQRLPHGPRKWLCSQSEKLLFTNLGVTVRRPVGALYPGSESWEPARSHPTSWLQGGRVKQVAPPLSLLRSCIQAWGERA